ncbi:hypothetical protein N9321_00545 [Flavobacteriaceae bacterium]|nr:hypothetical protein [Flavobacteriaceae bacterium]
MVVPVAFSLVPLLTELPSFAKIRFLTIGVLDNDPPNAAFMYA